MRSAECGVSGKGRSPHDVRTYTPHSALHTPHWGGAVIDLSGKRAFVTGGGRGIGRATGMLLAQAGARVAVGYRSRKADADETVEADRRAGGHAGSATGDSGGGPGR